MKLLFTSILVCQCVISKALDCHPSVSPPDPQSGWCGRALNNPTRKVGSLVEVNEYPWMGLIEYNKGGEIKLYCSAVLISARYALSTAVCFIGAAKFATPINVRLGEYDANNEGPDCIEVEDQRTCTDGAVRIPIEKTFVHPEYNSKKRTDDIAMIKLSSAAPYTNSIRPICLPTLDVALEHPKRFYMTVAGWGAVNATVRRSNVLRQVLVPYVDLNICRTKYSSKYTVNITERQICAGSKNRDSCTGDSGGPLMYRNRNVTELAGIVSYGPTPCGIDIPGVYTKVFAYKEWIRRTIEEEEAAGEVTTKPTIDPDMIYFKE